MSAHVTRVQLGAFGALAAIGVSVAAPAARAQQPSVARRATMVADEYMVAYFERYPELATFEGVPGARHDRLIDNSFPALRDWERREDRWYAVLRRVDGATLRGSDAVVHGLLLERLGASRQARVCRSELYPSEWVEYYGPLATIQPVGSDSLRRAALARWATLPRLLDTEIANARQGMRLGYTWSKSEVRRNLERMDAVLALPVDSSPFFSPAVRDSTPAFRAAFDTLVRARLVPAIRRYRAFMADEYLRGARSTIGVSATPNGTTCYRAKIRISTTVDHDPRVLHQLGLARMDTVEREMRALASKVFGDTVLPRIYERLRSDTQYTFRSGREIVTVADSAIARAKSVMPRWFGIVPRSDVRVEPFPGYLERGARLGQYSAAPNDGSRPALYRVNTYEPERRGRAMLQDITYHETIPGHHLQTAIAKERTNSHPVTRYLGTAAFSEGWAFYAERLADEMGLYSSDLSRMGMLSGQSLRAARLVVDAGIHALGWSRQQAIDYLSAHTMISAAQAAAEVDNYIASPGEFTAYMVGMLEILRLRTQAKQAFGDRFDIRAFHDRVLEDGSVTMPMLSAKITRWIASRPGRVSLR
jgi:uncharacterized protein (DUF885 family)